MRAGGAHMLSQRYATTVTDGSGTPVAKEWTTWYGAWSDGSHWRPQHEWVWRGDGTGTDGSIGDSPSTSCDQSGETVCTTEYVSYDAYGRPAEQRDARYGEHGQALTFTYGGVNNAFLTGASKAGLSVGYAYNSRGLLSQITDEAGNTRSFKYDASGRLEEVQNDSLQPVTTHEYFTQDCGAAAGEPGCTRTTAYGGPDSPDAVTTAYVDGLGRPVQTHQRIGSDDVITAQAYDALGRSWKSYRPYRENVGHAYDATLPSGQPVTTTTYYDDPLERVKHVNAPGAGQATMSYGVEDLTIGGSANAYRVETRTDEEGNKVKTYTDGLGRQVATVADPGGIAATTTFEYDLQDNLTKVVKPKGDAVSYAYGRAGRLLERDSPDAGRTEHVYDAAGNLRFREDANRRADGDVQFTRYDALGRPAESGVADANFSNLDGDQSYAFESDQSTWREVRAYDGAPTGYPWDTWSGASGLILANTEGRLAAEARRVKTGTLVLDGDDMVGAAETHVSSTEIQAGPFNVLSGGSVTFTAGQKIVLKPGFEARDSSYFQASIDPALDGGDPEWRLAFYDYDAEGRVTAKYVFAPGLGQVTIAYEYDRQGRLTWRHVAVDSDDFYQWYEYDERGLVKEVYASTESTKPGTPEVSYTYAADGQVDQASYRYGDAQSYAYNNRGWVTGLTGASAFAASYTYFNNGNVDVSTFDPVGQPSASYDYAYDAMSRLTSAAYSDGGSSPSGAYDLELVGYDANGNISTLKRRKETGARVDNLSYSYAAGTNRLQSLTDAAGALHGWDAGGGSFDYDLVGNMTQAPAPYGLVAASYDERNLPAAVEIASGDTTTTVSYRYSAGGERTYKKVEGAGPEHYLLDGAAALGVIEGGSLSHWNVVLPGGEVIGRHLAGGGRRYYLKDHLGSVRAVVDGSGAAVETRDYYPFGLRMPGRSTTEGTPAAEDFTGHERDAQTGWHYAGVPQEYFFPLVRARATTWRQSAEADRSRKDSSLRPRRPVVQIRAICHRRRDSRTISTISLPERPVSTLCTLSKGDSSTGSGFKTNTCPLRLLMRTAPSSWALSSTEASFRRASV